MLFHPFEIALCGYSGSGKTTLIAGVVRQLSEKYKVGYYKHGCHQFESDKEGKDSWVVRQAGAATVMISDPEKKAIITNDSTPSPGMARYAFADHDLLLVEGLKELPLPKLLLVDGERKILDLLSNGRVSNVAALVVPDTPAFYADYNLPVLARNSISDVTEFIETLLFERAAQMPLCGLVLAGGQSSRMGSDKALLHYHDDNQLLHTAKLLQQQCTEVFISCREDQAERYRHFGVPLVTDAYFGIGPFGGLLSAQQHRPNAAWIVVACDLPFLDPAHLSQLCSQRNPFRFATAFRDTASLRFEPLCACYEPKSRRQLMLQHLDGNNSLYAFLQESRIQAIPLSETGVLQSINDPDGYRAFTRQKYQ